MAEDFLVFSVPFCPCWMLSEFRFERFVKLSYELELTWMGYCGYCIPACTYRYLNDLFDRSMLTKHCRCFVRSTPGAADLLQALSHSPLLENLDLSYCNRIPAATTLQLLSQGHSAECPEIPAAAWRQLPDGAWPKLRGAQGIPEEELRRLRGSVELEGRTEGDPCRHDPSEGREEEDQ